MRRDFIFLASASPRRRMLLEQIGVPFEVRPSSFPEDPHPGESPRACVERLALGKADEVWASLSAAETRPVLAADTIVVLDDRLLGKPADEADALAMLERLSGRSHQVMTAVALRFGEERLSRVNKSAVTFRTTTEAERSAYCETGEPMGKAGSYAIQGRAAVFVEALEGSYSGVVGLPLAETASLLRAFDLPPWLQS